MALNDTVKIALDAQWREAGNGPLSIRGAAPVGGGDISVCYRLDTDQGLLFLKYLTGKDGQALFSAEYDGLRLLAGAGGLEVPEPLLSGGTGSLGFLVTRFLPRAAPLGDFWEIFAEGLAAQHRRRAPHFGLDDDNFIGLLAQENTPAASWPEFYARRRLAPLVRRCRDEGRFSPGEVRAAERLFDRLDGIFPNEPPALLHGDLWGGNYLSGPGGRPWIFDPAVYYGSREMDLAMARLFGGFDRKFFWHYEACYPLEPGWQERIPLCQLYPLLVHAVLFGGGYVRQAADVLLGF